MGLTKNRENFKLLVKFPPREKSPSNFYKIEAAEGLSQVRTLTPNFTILTLKM